MKNFGKFMTILLVFVFSPIINGFVFLKYWSWFIVPVFHVQSLNLVISISLVLFINFLKMNKTPENEDNVDIWSYLCKSIYYTILLAAIALIFGFILSKFI
jgi:hypothetical protein